jgi:hypothetical protein
VADELSPVEQTFVADMAGYIEPIEDAASQTQGFADVVDEAGEGLGSLRDKAAEAGGALDGLAASEDDAAGGAGHLRDNMGEAAAVAERLKAEIRAAGLEADETFLAGSAELDSYRDRLAEAALAAGVLKHEMDGVRDATAETDAEEAGGGFLSGLSAALSAIGGLFKGGVSSVLPDPETLAKLAVLAPLIGAAAVEAGMLASGITAAGLGVTAFAALAYPAISKVTGALGDNAKELAKLSPGERGAVLGLRQLKDEYTAMAKAFEPDALGVFNRGLKIAEELLPTLKPLADAAVGPIEAIEDKLEKFFAQPPKIKPLPGDLSAHIRDLAPPPPESGWDKFLGDMKQLEGPEITAIGAGLGKVTGSLDGLLTAFSRKDVINATNIAFSVLSGTVSALTGVLKFAAGTWDMTVGMIGLVSHDFDVARHAVAEFGRGVAEFGSDFNDVTKQMGTDEANWANDTRRDFDDARHAVASTWDGIRHDISSATDAINTDVSRFGSRVESDIVSAGHQIEAAWDRSWSAVVSYTRSIPGRILGALGNIGSLLFGAGERLVEGLINGVRSEVGALIGSVESMASSALSAAEHALGLGSPSRITRQHGLWLMEGYANGITEGRGLVEGALRSALGGVPGAFPPASSSMTGATVHLTMPVTVGAGVPNSPEYLQGLYRAVQEAALRYGQLNQSGGLTLNGRRP